MQNSTQMTKKIFKLIGFSLALAILVVTVVSSDAFAQNNEKEKAKRDKVENAGKGRNDKPDKTKGQPDKDARADKDNDKNGMADKNKPEKADGDLDKDRDKDREKVKGRENKVLKARNPLNDEKVIVCHKPGSGESVSISISRAALDAHIGHGDYEGDCRAADKRERTETVENEGKKIDENLREDVYTEIETTRSMTDYAEEVIREAEKRIRIAKEELEERTGSNILTVDEAEDIRDLITEAERDLEELRNEVKDARSDVQKAEVIVVELFD